MINENILSRLTAAWSFVLQEEAFFSPHDPLSGGFVASHLE